MARFRLTLGLIVGLMVATASESQDPTRIEEWEDLEIRSKVAAAMPYGHFRLDIYELQRGQSPQNSKKSYAYTPVVQLIHKSARSLYNPLTETHEVEFHISFWNDQVQKAVVKYLREELGLNDVKPSDVTVIRFNKVMLTTTYPSRFYSLSKKWENYRQEKTMKFTLYCKSAEDGQMVAELMRNSPNLFSSLQLGFTVSSRTSKTSYVTIKAESISTGKFFSKLNQRFPKQETVLLTAEDTNDLISESATNVVVESFSETETINPTSAIYNDLKNILVQSTITIDETKKALWSSVFWDQDNYRPDKTSETISDVYNKSDDESKKKLRDLLNIEREREENVSGGGSFSVGIKLFSASTSFNFAKGFRTKDIENNESEKEEMLKILREAKNRVEWKGTRFEPKAMVLSRINTGNVRRKTGFTDVQSTVTYATVGLSMRVVIDDTYNETPDSPLKAQVEDMEDLLRNHSQRLADLGNQITTGADELRQYIKAVNDSVFAMSVAEVNTQVTTRADELRQYIKAVNDSVFAKSVAEVNNQLSNLRNSVGPISERSMEKAKILTSADLHQSHHVLLKNDMHDRYLYVGDTYQNAEYFLRHVYTIGKASLNSHWKSQAAVWRVRPAGNGYYTLTSATCPDTLMACALATQWTTHVTMNESPFSVYNYGMADEHLWSFESVGTAFRLKGKRHSTYLVTRGDQSVLADTSPGRSGEWILQKIEW